MQRQAENSLALAAAATLVALVVDVVLAQRTHLLVLPALWPYLVITLGVCGLVFARKRLARLAEEEKRDQALAKREGAGSTLFAERPDELAALPKVRAHDQFERFLVPAMAPLLGLIQGYWAWRLHRGLSSVAAEPVEHLLAAAFVAAQAFGFFLLSRYLLGLSRHAEHRLLRGPGVLLGISCFASLAVSVSAVAAETGHPAADRVSARLLIGFLGVLGVESVLNFIGECYRPRKRREPNRAYESRLAGLLTDPATWVRNVSHALDYQFGFKVSETWFYRFLERALLPLILFQLLVLYLLSCLVFLGPEEAGILERFGRPKADWQLHSGLHLKWPWPFETVRRYPVKRILTMQIGHRMHSPGQPAAPPAAAHDAEPHSAEVILWTKPHYHEEEHFLVASREAPTRGAEGEAAVPVNLIAFNVPVEYQITNMYDYAYRYADPPAVLRQVAYRSLCLEGASSDLFEVMTRERLQTARALQARMQDEVNRLGLGVRIVFVGLQAAHPPVQVGEAFESVMGATEEKEAKILEARAHARRVMPLADAEAEKVGHAAEAYKVRRTEISAAESEQFLARLKTQERSPRVFRSRLYLDTLELALAGARKYVVAASPSTEVILFNFEEKLHPDLFDLGPETEKGTKP
jgi:membrane protease subunit HflK